MSAEAKLKELGIELPAPPAPAGLYAPAVQTGSLLFISGQIPTRDGAVLRKGRCGESVPIDDAVELARVCAINGLAAARGHLGSLDRIVKVVRIGGFVACIPGFVEQPKVVNGASQLMIDIFGEAGRHARAAVGVAELPAGVPVEVEFLFEVSE
jgi:enamine deaminase RidA (YjgF/YER057c/UK114 family)